MISATENSNKFPRFWKEKSVEDVVTLGPTAQVTLVFFEEKNSFFTLNFVFKNKIFINFVKSQFDNRKNTHTSSARS